MIGKDSHQETQCWKCHTSYVLPRALFVAAKASEKISFFCPYGHEGHFASGETEEDKLRRERDRLKQQMAHKEELLSLATAQLADANNTLIKERKQLRKIHTRVAGGVCPCCNRSFVQLQRHMKTKHPLWELKAA